MLIIFNPTVLNWLNQPVFGTLPSKIPYSLVHIPYTCMYPPHVLFPPNNSHSVFYLSKKGVRIITSLAQHCRSQPLWQSAHSPMTQGASSSQTFFDAAGRVAQVLPISTFCIPGHIWKDNRQHSDNPGAHNTPPLRPRWIESNLSERWAICSASIIALTNILYPHGAIIQQLPAVLPTQLCLVLMLPCRPWKGQAQSAPMMPSIASHQEALGKSRNKDHSIAQALTSFIYITVICMLGQRDVCREIKRQLQFCALLSFKILA